MTSAFRKIFSKNLKKGISSNDINKKRRQIRWGRDSGEETKGERERRRKRER